MGHQKRIVIISQNPEERQELQSMLESADHLVEGRDAAPDLMVQREEPGVDLYANVVAIFGEASAERLSSEAVSAALLKRHGLRISKNALARQLRSCGIRPKLLKIAGRSICGYERAAFDRL